MSKLEQIESFINVVHENGFAAAARKLGISTAAISRQISRLEAELGATLLERTSRQIKLTEIGFEYYQHGKKALLELEEAEALISGSRQEPEGTLNITSNRYFANEFIIPYLAEFAVRYPRLILNIELAERFPDFRKEEIDILFGVSLEGPPDLVRKRIASTRYVLCASPDYFQKNGTPKSPDELCHYQYITHTGREPNNVLRFRNNKSVVVKPSLYINDSQSIYECAMRGLGIALLTDYLVKDAINNGLLVEIFKEYQEPEMSIYLYYSAQRYLQPKIRHFIDYFSKKSNPTIPS